MLMEKLWCVLEGQADADDYRITAPRAHPLDILDRASHKVQGGIVPPHRWHVCVCTLKCVCLMHKVRLVRTGLHSYVRMC